MVAILVAGCASDKGIDDTDDDYTKKPLTDRHGDELEADDAERLYEAARDLLMHGQPGKALPLYGTVIQRFPFTDYATQSSLERIAARFEMGDYDKAVEEADRFIRSNPQSPHIDYVYYMRGRSNYARNNPGMLWTDQDKRNVEYLKQAFNDFNLLLENYRDSDYINDARQHMIDIRNRIAKAELRIAEYYYRRNAYVGAARRAENVVKYFQGSDSIPRALEIMEQSYAKLNIPDLANDTRAVLQESYPNYVLHRDEFYRQQKGDKARYDLPDMDAAPAAGRSRDDEDDSDDDDTEEADDEDTAMSDDEPDPVDDAPAPETEDGGYDDEESMNF